MSGVPTDSAGATAGESIRTGLSACAIAAAVRDQLAYQQARRPQDATPYDWYMALAASVRDRLLAHWLAQRDTHAAAPTLETLGEAEEKQA